MDDCWPTAVMTWLAAVWQVWLVLRPSLTSLCFVGVATWSLVILSRSSAGKECMRGREM